MRVDRVALGLWLLCGPLGCDSGNDDAADSAAGSTSSSNTSAASGTTTTTSTSTTASTATGPVDCDGSGDSGIAFSVDGEPLAMGATLSVFPQGQGGARTVLDLNLGGIAGDDVRDVSIVIDDDQGAALADQTYEGPGLAPICLMDGTIDLLDVPVEFVSGVDLAALDGAAATVRVSVGAPELLSAQLEVSLGVGA